MPKFPEPDPARLRRLAPAVIHLPAGTRLWRVYARGGAYPTTWLTPRTFGPIASARFDHHLEPARVQARGILYAASAPAICLAEVFQARRLIDVASGQPWLASFRLTDEVIVLDLTGLWPTQAGASMALASGPRPRARRWSRAIYDAYPVVQGLWYPSSMHGNQPAVALYERAQAALPPHPSFHRALADPVLLPLLRRVAIAIGYDLP
jgi:hypothetical protein